MKVPNRERLDDVWRRISRIDARPAGVVAQDDPRAEQKIRAFLDEYVVGSAAWLDCPGITPRPVLLPAATADQCIALNGPSLEFIVVRDDDPIGFRAVTEEEYEWHLYANPGNLS